MAPEAAFEAQMQTFTPYEVPDPGLPTNSRASETPSPVQDASCSRPFIESIHAAPPSSTGVVGMQHTESEFSHVGAVLWSTSLP
ncbi:hypothetical protein LTR37_001620, partial [Vermiconidia calcicola]